MAIADTPVALVPLPPDIPLRADYEWRVEPDGQWMMLCVRGGPLPFLTAEDITADAWCCMGSVNDGPTGCTCWSPIYDLEQVPPAASLVALLEAGIEPVTRAKRCIDCAFRPDSPERERDEDLEGLPNFWCHQGIRRPIAHRHPDGRIRPEADSADYQPPIVAGVPYRADGTPAERCAGHAQLARAR
jgi:hypothetical protein